MKEIKLGKHLPLRVVPSPDGRAELRSPYETYPKDTVIAKSINPETVRLTLTPPIGNVSREIFISESPYPARDGKQIIATMSGDRYSGAVDVYPWKDRVESGMPSSGVTEERRRELVRLVDLHHVEEPYDIEDKKGPLGEPLDVVVQHHNARLGERSQLPKMPVERAVAIYEALLYTVPK
jgi:hypothetical protein